MPAEHRYAVAAYVDARDRLTAVPPKVEELRQHGEPGDTAAVHALVGHHLALLEDQLRALDALQVSLSEARRQPWASQLLSDECQDIKERQDCVSASLVEYHLGAAAGTQANLWLWVQGFDLPGGFIPLIADSAPAPEAAAV
ncbi:hypothetical protein [Kitasatospora sp. NPDC017646]|uniref:hypothetical protein n=1 Tax=Kitasatospora sp. NPDC017646 TaxID=3364024 RepID=UPI00378CC73A